MAMLVLGARVVERIQTGILLLKLCNFPNLRFCNLPHIYKEIFSFMFDAGGCDFSYVKTKTFAVKFMTFLQLDN